MTDATVPAARHPGGRPTDYREEYNELAYNYCLLGATDVDLAKFFSVSKVTINNWKRDYPEFLNSIRAGKEIADGQVARSLFKRATGFVAPETHISAYQGDITETQLERHYPPDTTACIFWLKNRQRENWKDVHRVESTGPDGEALSPPVFNIVPVPPKAK